MRTPEQIAVAVIKSLLGVGPLYRVCGDVTSLELCSLLVEHLTSCPKCGTEPGCNIDCDLCNTINILQKIRRGE